MENGSKRRSEVEIKVLDKVGEVISELHKAKHADQVISALHSLAILLFPLDSSLFSGAIGERCREQVPSVEAPSADERSELRKTFYRGAAFRTFARVLLTDVVSNWLACFPFSARKHVYDVFFVNGLATEVVQILVPCLQQNEVVMLMSTLFTPILKGYLYFAWLKIMGCSRWLENLVALSSLKIIHMKISCQLYLEWHRLLHPYLTKHN